VSVRFRECERCLQHERRGVGVGTWEHKGRDEEYGRRDGEVIWRWCRAGQGIDEMRYQRYQRGH